MGSALCLGILKTMSREAGEGKPSCTIQKLAHRRDPDLDLLSTRG